MHTRDWTVLVISSTVLPWLAIQLISFAAIYAPIFIWYLDESYSRSSINLAIQFQRQFENLVFAVPTGALLALVIRGTPITTALLVIAGYSIAWIAWGFLEGFAVRDSMDLLLVYYHLPIPLLLGFAVFSFGKLYEKKRQEDA